MANGVIKVPVRSELMRICYETSSKKDPETLVWGVIGPELFAKVLKQLNLSNYILPFEALYPVMWYDWKDIITSKLATRLKLKFKITKKVYAVHLWNEMWRLNGIDKNSCYHPKCLYEKLKKKYLS